MPPQVMVEGFPTILRDKHHMILAVPRGMIQSLDVWHDRLPLRATLSGSREGVCCFDSRSCQTLGVPRQSRGFTLGNKALFAKISLSYGPGGKPGKTTRYA